MAKTTEWESNIGEKTYEFSCVKSGGNYILAIDGNSQTIKARFLSWMIGFDERFEFDGYEARLVVERNIPDIVVDNVFLQSGKPYVEKPKWVIVFAVLCILIPIVSLGGAIPAILGIGGAAACVKASTTGMGTPAKVLICGIITVVAWLLWFALIFLLQRI